MEEFLIIFFSFALVGLVILILHLVTTNTKSGKTEILFTKYFEEVDKATTPEDILKCNELLDQILEVDPKNSRAYVYKASTLVGLDKNNEALICYKRALEADPYNLEVHHQAAFFYLIELKDRSNANKHFDEALSLLEDEIEKNPDVIELRKLQIDILEAKNDSAEKLMECYGQIIDKFVFKKGESKFLFGKVKYAMELLPQQKINTTRLGQDIERLEILMREDMAWDETQLVKLINVLKTELNKYTDQKLQESYLREPVEIEEEKEEEPEITNEELLADIESQLAANPTDIEILKKKAGYYVYVEPDYAKALQCLDEIIAIDPDNASYVYKIFLLNKIDDAKYVHIAEECCDFLLKKDKHNDDNYNSLWKLKLEIASHLHALGDEPLDTVLSLIDRYSRLPYSTQLTVYEEKASAYFDAGEEYWEKAIETLDRGIARGVSPMRLNYLKANIYIEKKMYEDALVSLNKALLDTEIDSSDKAQIYTLMADIYTETGNEEKSAEYNAKVEYLNIINAFSSSMDEIK